MTTHPFTRLVWHDGAWDGHASVQPSQNASTPSRVLLSTVLTRFYQRMVLLVEPDTAVPEKLRNPQ